MTSEAPPRGLPEHLPAGEHILWQGAPDALTLARTAYHARTVAIYFAVLTAVALGLVLSGSAPMLAVIATAAAGGLAVAILHLLAWAMARSSVYTLTDRRIVLRVGVALPKSINLPLARIAAVDLSSGGDIALRLTETPPLGWAALWPHAKPWALARPEPMLRSLPDAATVAAGIGRACLAAQPDGRLREPAFDAPVAPAPAAALVPA